MDLSTSGTAQRESFEEKLECSGWKLTLNGRSFLAIVALGQMSAVDKASPQLTGRSIGGKLTDDIRLKSTIEFLIDSVPSIPAEGDTIIDERGINHRIRDVFQSEFTYQCRCHMSNPV